MGKIFDALQKSTRKADDALIREEVFIADNEAVPTQNDAAIEVAPAPRKVPPLSGVAPVRPPAPEAPGPKNRRHASDTQLIAEHRLAKSLIAVHDPHSFEAEQFRMLRTNLLFPKSGRPAPRTILVTSVLPGEGKSFVSANLAATIAQNVDNHVLLIDADMRNPTIHKLFNLNHANGLSDYLSKGRPMPEILHRAHTPRLTILPGGLPPSNPSELISSKRMAALLREVKARYDDRYIIIDSPPPHLTSESNALAKFVDGIIIVVKFNATPRELVTDLISNFEEGKVIGIVANWMERGTQFYYGSEKYSKHYIGKKKGGK